ncbi:Ubiquitin-like modifier-activating enzyme ATG7 [Paramicrosporidium saccamoebae]|uniref:Ubiquitin-like modifier-activating enzyme ATG7 n=1 Tax=Paramicrosporidium saccamoebae TaxID=1246581 RepID=A0A2H9TI94_9FUNG|nr:Ubiquitin-like modifier-activating enzyme ATG7 [Paramicrosporidium saccamoebae]
MNGTLRLYNTLEDFKDVDKAQIMANVKTQVTANAQITTDSAQSLLGFVMIAFADLKKHKYYYHILYPALFDPHAVATCIRETIPGNVDLKQIRRTAMENRRPWFRMTTEEYSMLVFVDPGPLLEGVLGWPARNMIWTECRDKTKVLCLAQTLNDTKMFSIQQKCASDSPQVTGWEKNETGAVAPTIVDLAPLMDPRRLAQEAADLNIRLIKWRLLPDLDIDRFKTAKVLLFGAGTLGCNVTRLLLGWGVQNITLVDNGRVSFSNPPRQSLFRFEDCVNGGRPKAETAALRALEIDPNAKVVGISTHIPMPGHVITDKATTRKDVEKIMKLVDEHDILFLLTDSRESRWLPAVLGSAANKTVITIALGFDSYVAMRHGSGGTKERLGCYFCHDINAPGDSMKNRTLDQQCTVTRPGISYLAAATGVELLAAILQHPLGNAAPATMTPNATDALSADTSLLGVIPHQVRGYLSHFQNMQLIGEAFQYCTACSSSIQQAIHTDGCDFLMKALEDPSTAALISGASSLQIDPIEADPIDNENDINNESDNGNEFCLL